MPTPQIRKREDGQSLVLVALSLIVLLGMLGLAIDIGRGYAARRRMQNAADAGALAGAWLMAKGGTDSQIASVVHQYTQVENGAGSYVANYLPGMQAVGGGSVPANATGVRVVASITIPTYFASLLGLNQISASSNAAAGGYSPLDIALVFDRSGSMDDDSCSLKPYPDRCGRPINQTNCTACGGTWTNPPQPITAAKNAAKYFVDLNNPNLTHLALASFSDSATLNRQLTSDFNAIKSSIDALTASGSTCTSGGIRQGRLELTSVRKRPDAIRFIILLSDGIANKYGSSCQYSCPSIDGCSQAYNAAVSEASTAAANGIVIYSIGLGMEADMGLMEDVAAVTGGEAFFAPTASDLIAIYQMIFDRIRLRLVL
jgi:hypothetical protein